MSIGVKHETFFSYPQVYIKNTLIDNIRAVRNSLFAPSGRPKLKRKTWPTIRTNRFTSPTGKLTKRGMVKTTWKMAIFLMVTATQ
ncbi:MAG: hypothetical protein V8T12_07390 [Parabacteroides johnsonii]